MALQIACSARYFKTSTWYFDKITEEYNPPAYWFRLKVFAKGKMHKQCIGHIVDVWYGNFRAVSGFDQLILYWLSEPPQMPGEEGNIAMGNKHYTVDIRPGTSELASLMLAKLPAKPVPPGTPVPANNIPEEQLPEVRIDHSRKESVLSSKRMNVPYGTYYVKVRVSDSEGASAEKIFKVWAYRDPKKCEIRTSRFYERWMLWLKSFLPAV